MATATAGGAAAPGTPPPAQGRQGSERAQPRRGVLRTRPWVAASFLLPSLVLLGALVVYPIAYSVFRSLSDAAGPGVVCVENYVQVFTDEDILTAVKNNLIWVIVAPSVSTALG